MTLRPKQLRYGSDGVPILSATQVEDVATEVLQKHCPAAHQILSSAKAAKAT
jgi:hypothetical protein